MRTTMIEHEIAKVMQALENQFEPSLALAVPCGAYQVHLTDRNVVWHMMIEAGRCRAMAGPHPKPVIVSHMSQQTLLALSTGELTEMMAWMTGRLKVEGDLRIAFGYTRAFRKLAAGWNG
jgi:putative sterol carrier protein